MIRLKRISAEHRVILRILDEEVSPPISSATIRAVRTGRIKMFELRVTLFPRVHSVTEVNYQRRREKNDEEAVVLNR